ncbi:efflux RND transporter permease subunit [Bacteroidales bacterium OttesenSCG-928-K22]|nr:efflux RND transporter permease subunit [Bacteroidales bacterium OttesenSCG-928-K22]
MSIYKTAINKPITTALIFVAVVILGVFSLQRLPIDQYPEMEPPYVSVMTVYPGANGSEIETNVTRLLENSLNSVDGLKEIYSTSMDNMSIVMLEFNWGANLDESINDVRSSIDMVYEALPDDCNRPTIYKFNSSMMPIMQYAITAKESYVGLEKILDDQVVNSLNRIDGIGSLSISGAPSRYVYVELDPNKINSYNLSLEAVGQAIATSNLNLASGTVKMGNEQYQLRVQGEFVESSEIDDIVVTTTYDGKQIYIRDLAVVRDTIKDLSLEEKINGMDGVRMIVMKQSGANSVQVCKDVVSELEKIKPNLPPDIDIELIYDSSEYISNAINGLTESIMYALLFVVLVVLFFLGKWRATIIIGVTIPISLVVAFIYLLFVDSSLNIISLCSLTIAIGMVVDDAIVVLENITRHIERGSSPREAAIYATNEVWVSVIATTLVIAAVFVPLTMLGGQMGVIFKEMGWIVTIVVVTSTVVAITLTPMLSSKLLKSKKANEERKAKRKRQPRFTYENTVVRFLDKVDVFYAKALRVCMNHRLITLSVAVILFALSLIPLINGRIGFDFMPQEDNGRFSVYVELQRGTRVEETAKIARAIEEKVMVLVPEAQLISTSTGSSDEASISSLFSQTSSNAINMTVRTSKKYERERTIFDIAEVVRQELSTMPEVTKYQVTTSGGMGGSNSVDIQIFGYDFDQTNALALEIEEKLKDVQGARDIKISREEDRAELQINFDKEKLALHGLTTATAATYVRNRVNGMTVGYLKEDGEEYDIVVRLEEDYRNSITDIEELTLMTPTGQMIKLKELATIEEYWAPPKIDRQRRERIVTVSATPVNIALSDLVPKIQEVVDNLDVPQGIVINIGGSYEDQQETFGDLTTLFLLIVMLVYVVMASQFESFSKPLILMSSVLFAITGVVAALLITNATLDMIGALGIILLVGIVVKNGIVLVDYINLMRDRGYEMREAIALSGQSRLRPVLMTAVTTILGMLPMALSTSEGSEIWVPLGIVVIGGLTVSTIVTLIVVPVLYSFLSKSGERNKSSKIRKTFVFMDQPDPNGNGNGHAPLEIENKNN